MTPDGRVEFFPHSADRFYGQRIDKDYLRHLVAQYQHDSIAFTKESRAQLASITAYNDPDYFAPGKTEEEYLLAFTEDPVDEEWEVLLEFRSSAYHCLLVLTEMIGLDAVRHDWEALRALDLRMGKAMPVLYPLIIALHQKHLIGISPHWILPTSFDPENPFPNMPYPLGIRV